MHISICVECVSQYKMAKTYWGEVVVLIEDSCALCGQWLYQSQPVSKLSSLWH